MDSIDAFSPILPIWLLVPAQIAAVALLVGALYAVRDVAGRFVVCAIWLRLNLSALHEYTYAQIFAGFSFNALVSIAIVLVGLYLLDKKLLLLRYIVPIYIIICVFVLSGIISGRYNGMLDVTFKYLYFLVVALSTYRSLTIDKRAIATGVMLAFAPIIIFQLLSFIFGIAKVGGDGSLNYIGGFDHEASFSLALAGLFFVSILASGVPARYRALGMVCALIGIVLANYRTTMIGMAPLGIYAMFAATRHSFEPKLRDALLLVMASVVAIGMFAGVVTSDRFADVGNVASGNVDILRSPESFTREDKQVFTGRVYIWSLYLDAWSHADAMHQMIGFGPESWKDNFELYAHNTFVGILFDFGVLGELALLFLIGTGIFLGAMGAAPLRMVTAHVSFFIINLATMPFWMIAGLITYGFIWGYTLFELDRAREALSTPALRFGRPVTAKSRAAEKPALSTRDASVST